MNFISEIAVNCMHTKIHIFMFFIVFFDFYVYARAPTRTRNAPHIIIVVA
jgi:hypothetical protein